MKILVGFDGSAVARHALRRALSLFAPCRPEVILVRALVQPMTLTDLAERAFEAARREAEAELEEAAREVREAGLPVRLRLIEGEPRQVLGRVAGEEAPDVVVVGARGQGSLARAVLGSVSSYAVHHLDDPVLVVR